jgi:hypothetical protein
MLEIKRELRNSRTGEKSDFTTNVIIKMTETDLSFEFFCKNSKFYSADDKYNGPIFDGDVCEAFISTDGTINNYFEIEVAPNNTVFLNRIYNPGGGAFQTFPIDESENFVTSEVEINGNDYRLKFSVPLEKIGYTKEKGILFNAYRIETEGGHTDLHLLALNPTMCDTFHMSEYFIKLEK